MTAERWGALAMAALFASFGLWSVRRGSFRDEDGEEYPRRGRPLAFWSLLALCALMTAFMLAAGLGVLAPSTDPS